MLASKPPMNRAPASTQAVSNRCRLLGVHQRHRLEITAVELGPITKGQREIRETSTIVLGELNPRAHLRRVQGQRRGELALAGTVVVVAARVGQLEGRRPGHQRGVHHLEFHERPTPTNCPSTWR